MQKDLTAAPTAPGEQADERSADDGAWQRRVAELEAKVADLEARLDKQRSELERRREQAASAQADLLRVRDLLITSDRMLGQIKGENESLQDQLFSYQGLLQRYHDVVNSTTWKLSWKVLTPYRNFRTRQGGS
jgi:chromosome segregation ATPase